MTAAAMTPTTTAPGRSSSRHLLALRGLPAKDLRSLLASARDAAATPPVVPGGLTIATLFFEDSTRTRTSFTLAAHRCGLHCVDLSAVTSSVNKGETLIDTALTVEAMGVQALIVRARQSGAAALIAQRVRIPVLNAGDGRHEHPTQGLLDAMTVAKAFDRLDTFDFRGVHVAIVGDIISSRVARSAIAAFTTLGARVTCVGPASMAPASLASLGVEVSPRLDAVVDQADAVMMLRIQFERHASGEPGKAPTLASVREYRAFYALTTERAARMKDHAIVLHPGPMNRGIEIDAEVADAARSRVLAQVANGVPVRMAALAWCLGRV